MADYALLDGVIYAVVIAKSDEGMAGVMGSMVLDAQLV